MKVRIERIINNCNCCRYGKRFQEEGGNTDFILVCNYKSEPRFVVAKSTNRNHCITPIPEACPLEVYSGRGECFDDE